MEPLLPAWFTALIAAVLLLLALVVIYKLVMEEFRIMRREHRAAKFQQLWGTYPVELIKTNSHDD